MGPTKGRAGVTRVLVVLLLVLAGVLWSGPLAAHAKAIVSLDALQGAFKLYGFLFDGLSYL